MEELLHKEFLISHSENEMADNRKNHFYWKVKKGNTLESNFGKILGKKGFKDCFTSRNLNTFDKILNKL